MKTCIPDHKHGNAFCQFGDMTHGQNVYDLLVLKNLFCSLDNNIISFWHDNQLADWGS